MNFSESRANRSFSSTMCGPGLFPSITWGTSATGKPFGHVKRQMPDYILEGRHATEYRFRTALPQVLLWRIEQCRKPDPFSETRGTRRAGSSNNCTFRVGRHRVGICRTEVPHITETLNFDRGPTKIPMSLLQSILRLTQK